MQPGPDALCSWVRYGEGGQKKEGTVQRQPAGLSWSMSENSRFCSFCPSQAPTHTPVRIHVFLQEESRPSFLGLGVAFVWGPGVFALHPQGGGKAGRRGQQVPP